MAFSRKHSSQIRIQVPGSTSNVGPGFDCFGIALDHYLTIDWQPADKMELLREGPLEESTLTSGRDPVLRGMRRAATLAGTPLPVGKITVNATYPPGRGLGASGAGLVAGLMLGNRLTGSKLDTTTLHHEAIALDGHPENATASILGGAHWSAPDGNGEWRHIPVPLHKDLRFLIVVPPYPLATSRAREVLPSTVSFNRAVSQARRTPILLEGLKTLSPELIKIGVEDDLHVAARLRLLTGAKSVLEFAEASGAMAATLSGAGSALLILTRTGAMQKLEAKLVQRVKRLWGESGKVLNARTRIQGPNFLN